MQTLLTLPPGQLYLIPRENTFELTIELALNGGLRLLICGNRLPFYDISYELARRVGQAYERILKEKISFSRAETCTQLVDFLSEMDAQTSPLLVSDLLSRFYAEADSQADRHVDQLFFACQVELQRLSQDSLIFLSANPKPPLERLGRVLGRITRQINPQSNHISQGNHHGPHTATLFPPIQD